MVYMVIFFYSYYIRMSFIIDSDGKISVVNSTISILNNDAVFTGTGEDITKYASVSICIATDKNSSGGGVSLEFSSDNVNWDKKIKYTLDVVNESFFRRITQIYAKYFRIVYTNGNETQTYMRLQTKYHITTNELKELRIDKTLVDGFNRLRVSEPYTVLDCNFILGKRTQLVSELITGLGSSTYNSIDSTIDLKTTGTGTIIRQSRARGIYQPGKSLLTLFTGILNGSSNASTVISRIGYYDNEDGYYFKYTNGIFSLVERTSVSGSLVENEVKQSNFNKNKLDGSEYLTIDVSKTQIFYIQMQWLGVGNAIMGVIIGGELYPLHVFYHANIKLTTYIRSASQPIRYELSSPSGGSGSLKQICYTVISEGGYNPEGSNFFVGANRIGKDVGIVIYPLICVRLKTGSKTNCILKYLNIMSSTNGNIIIYVYKFFDTLATSFLTGSNFQSVSDESSIEADVSSTAITTTNSILIYSGSFSNNSDSIVYDFIGIKNAILTSNISSLSDIICLCAVSISGGSAETLHSSLGWSELR